MENGYVKLYRKTMLKGWFKNPEYTLLWIYCLLKANHKPVEMLVNNKLIKIGKGEFLTSRRQISLDTGIQESKIERILSCFKTGQQIEQQGFSKYRLISITNWSQYQETEQQIEQKMNSKRTASEQQVNTNKNEKNEKNEKPIADKSAAVEVVNLWNEIIIIPNVQKLTEARKKKIGLRLKTLTIEELREVFTRIKASPFLTGKNDRGWKATFDWIIENDDNAVKVLEGKYDSTPQQPEKQVIPVVSPELAEKYRLARESIAARQ